jgi:hypothetical protein
MVRNTPARKEAKGLRQRASDLVWEIKALEGIDRAALPSMPPSQKDSNTFLAGLERCSPSNLAPLCFAGEAIVFKP